MFGAAALVRRHQVLVAVILTNGVLQVVEVAAARIGFIAHHQAGPLAVAHGRGAGIGQQVDVNVLAAQQEGVVTGLPYGTLAFFAGGHAQWLDHLDLVGFGPGVVFVLLCVHVR